MYRLCLLCFVVLIFGCKSQLALKDGMSGTWQWVSTSGGFGGLKMNPESSGYSRQIIVDGNHISIYQGDSLTISAAFLLYQGKTIFSEQEADLIQVGDLPEEVIRLSGDSLFLQENVYDGFSHIYVRKR